MPDTKVKKQGETSAMSFDFADSMTVGETISTQVVTAFVWSGVDASPSALILGTPTINVTAAIQNITGGIAGVIYSLICLVTTNLGQSLELPLLLYIEPDLP